LSLRFYLLPFLIVEQYALTGLAALKIAPEAFPSESISVIDGAFQWNDKAFEVLLLFSLFINRSY